MSLSPRVGRMSIGLLGALAAATVTFASSTTTYNYDNAGNLIGVTGCVPWTCAQRGDSCGATYDGCSGSIWCTCSASQVCNIWGTCLALSTTSLSFSGVAGGSNPAAQTVIASNSGGGGPLAIPTTSINYGSGNGWLNTTVGGSAAPFTITVTPNISGLTYGTYTATVTVSSVGAFSSPQTVNVTLTVAPDASTPVLLLSTTSLRFSGPAGGSNPAAQTVVAYNSSGGTLAKPTASISYGSGSGWLIASIGGSAAPYTISITPSVSGLSAGSYTATVTVSSAEAASSPQSINVVLIVNPSGLGDIGEDVGFLVTEHTAYWDDPVDVIVSTGGVNRLLVASVDYGGGGGGEAGITDFAEGLTISGGGLTWTRAVFGMSGLGSSSQIWFAWAPEQLTYATVTVAPNTIGNLFITIEAFYGARDPTGLMPGVDYAVATATGVNSPAVVIPSVTIKGTIGSWLLGSASVWEPDVSYGGSPRTYDANNVETSSLIEFYKGMWTVRRSTPLSAGTYSIGDSGPATNCGWSMVAAEVLASSPPALSLSTTSLAFVGTAGGSNPTPLTVTASNIGGSTLAVPSASISYGSGNGWLNTNVSGSAAPYTITVTPNISGLSAGTYTAAISVNSAGASSSPQTVNVTLIVTPGSSGSGPTVDSGFPVYANGSPGVTNISSPVFSTAAGRKLVAVVMGGLITDHLVETVTSVSGGGLTWTREVFANYSNGKNDLVEIWSAWTDVALSGVQVTATFADNGNGSLDPSIVVYSISGAQAASGVTGRASAGHYDDTPGGGLQSVALSGVAAGSLVIAGATDWWANNTSFSPFPGATIDYHWMPVGVSSLWSLHATAPSAGSFTIGTSSASTQTEWQMVALEIKGGSNGIAPYPPADPNATGLSSSSILLTWTASTNATSYKVESAPDIGGIAGVWTEIAPGVTETNFADINLPASTTYWYRVRATNAYGDSDYSPEVSATTTAGGGAPKTFGRTTEGGSWANFPNPGSISVCRFTLTENASVTKLSIIYNAAASGHFKGVIYRAGAVNNPTTLVASTSEITSFVVGINDLPFTIPASLTPGDYYLGVWGDQSASVNASASAGDNVWYSLPYTGTAPATWDTAAQKISSNQKPIYATYTTQ